MRELQNVLERSILACKEDVIEAEALLTLNAVSTTSSLIRHPQASAGEIDSRGTEAEPLTNQIGFEDVCQLLVNQSPLQVEESENYNIFEKLEGDCTSGTEAHWRK